MARVLVYLAEICILTTTLRLVLSRSGGTASERVEASYYVDSASGLDSGKCGNVSLPCRTLAWTVTRSREAPENSSVYLFIAAGVYTETVAVKLGGELSKECHYRLVG